MSRRDDAKAGDARPERERSTELPDPAATPVRDTLAYLVVASVCLPLALLPRMPAVVVFGALTVLAGGLGWLFSRLWRRVIELERRGPSVRLKRAGWRRALDESLPVGEGHLVVTARQVRAGRRYYLAFDVAHQRGDAEVRLTRSRDFLRARGFAERLARFGRWDLVWRPYGGGDDEVRAPHELDVPLSERLLARPEALQPSPPPSVGIKVRAEPLPGGGFRLLWPFHWKAPAVISGCVVFIAGMLALRHGHAPLVFGVTGGLLGALGLLASFRTELLASREEVRHRARFLGLWPLPLGALPGREIESVLVEPASYGVQLRLAGDRRSLTVPCPDGPLEAAWARYHVEQALIAGGSAAPPRSAPTERPKAAGLCPRCYGALDRVGGPLDEARCPSCAGRFLPPHGSERLVVQELGLSRDLLRQITEVFAGPRLFCAGCGSRMSPVRLKGVDADLCTGCGALWLDRGELETLSQGRYEG